MLVDRLDGLVVGQGYVGLRTQMENRIDNVNWKLSTPRRKAAVALNYSPVASSKHRDTYGCFEYLPEGLPEGEDETSQTAHSAKKEKKLMPNNPWNGA